MTQSPGGTFEIYNQVAPLDPEVMEALEAGSNIPPELMELWRTHGTGFIGRDSYVRIIDPAKYAAVLPEAFGLDPAHALPFMTTGMGDMFVYEGGFIRHVLYRFGEVRNIAPKFELFFQQLNLEPYLDVYLERADYPEGVKRLGIPPLDSAFFYVPFLALGGRARPENLDMGDLGVSLLLHARMVGPFRA